MRREDQDVWFYRAEQDWVAIRAMLVYPEAGWSQVSFHAQQAAEKCLKAFIAYNKEEPRRTHDLEELLETAIKYDSSLPVSVEDCNYLNQFAVDARYGDFDDEYSEESARDAVEAAKRICSAVRGRIAT